MVLEDHPAVVLLFERLLVERTIRECLNYDDKLVGMPLHLRLSWPMHYTLKSDSMIPELLWLHSSKSTLGEVSELRRARRLLTTTSS